MTLTAHMHTFKLIWSPIGLLSREKFARGLVYHVYFVIGAFLSNLVAFWMHCKQSVRYMQVEFESEG